MSDHYIPVPTRVAAWRTFYRKANRRPLLGFFLGSEYPIHRYPYAATLPDDRPVVPEDFDASVHARTEALLFEAHEDCGGYFIHAGSAYWGVPWLEALMGCEIRASHATGSLYAVPVADALTNGGVAIEQWAPPRFDPDASWAALAGEMLSALAAESAGRFPLATTRMRGVADMLAAVFGGEELIMAMLDRPDEVHRLAASLTDLYIEFGRHQLSRIPEFHGGIGSFYYSMWAPPGTVWHQEDSSMLLSPELYDAFVRPYDERIFSAFSGNIVHFHSTGGYLPIRPILELRPTAVELHRDSGGPSAEQLFDYHKTIMEGAPLLIWGALTDQDLEWIFTKLPPEGLAVQAAVESVAAACEIWDRFGGPAV